MKKSIFSLILVMVMAGAAQADVLWQELFNYSDGAITNASNGVWTRHSGTASPSDAKVFNHRLENSATGGTLTRQDDVHRDLPAAYTNSPTILYASFIVNCTNLPSGAGGYFVHFLTGSTTFYGKLWAFTNGTALKNTWRLGVSASSAVTNQFPVDLAMNTDYQVVLMWDPTPEDRYAMLWVNPIASSDSAVGSVDTVASAPPVAMSFASRQASSFGNFFCTISNLVVATSFEEAATNVVSTAPTAPFMAVQPKTATNFVGDTVNLSALAAGQGIGGFTYQWLKNGVAVGAQGNLLSLTGASETDSGAYQVVVTSANGLSVTSSVANLTVANPPVPPVITLQPVSASVYKGRTVTFTVAAGGVGLTYAWYYNNVAISTLNNPNFSGDGSSTLTVANVQSANNTAGTYRCNVGNAYGTTPSGNAVLSVTTPAVKTIAELKAMVDPVFFLVTNSTTYWTVSNAVVTSYAPMTGGANSSFTIQDSTGGITVYVAGGASMLPAAGDLVTVVGPLANYNGLMEMSLNASDTSTSVNVTSHNNPLPAAIALPFNFTNGVAAGSIGNAIRLYSSTLVTFTNVYFVEAGASFGAGGTYTMTNQVGEGLKVFLNSAMTNLNGVTIPAFARSITGPMGYYLSNTATDRSLGFELNPTRADDVVTNALPLISQIQQVDGKPSLTWPAMPFTCYSILSSTNLDGPYLPVANGLMFNSTVGQFLDTNTGLPAVFYKITTP